MKKRTELRLYQSTCEVRSWHFTSIHSATATNLQLNITTFVATLSVNHTT